jgi:diguanylate cyclase (GGDEF)-like protein
VQSLYEVFTLVLLDPATTPTRPVSPNYILNFVLSVTFGLALGAGLAFLSQYLEAPLGTAVGMNIIDAKTGVYNREYFLRRLNEEMIRAKRNKYPLSLALMRVDNLSLLQGMEAGKIRDDLLRQVATRTNQYLREEDIVAYLENETLALLLPDMTGENAKALMEYLQTLVSWTPFEADLNGPKFNLKGVVGITTYNHNGTSRDELLARAKRALQLAEVDGNGKTYMITPAQYAASS